MVVLEQSWRWDSSSPSEMTEDSKCVAWDCTVVSVPVVDVAFDAGNVLDDCRYSWYIVVGTRQRRVVPQKPVPG